jgi:hypothetical protein
MLVVALKLGSSAGGMRAGLVEHRRQVLEVLPRIMPLGLMAMITRAREILELKDHLPVAMGVPPPAIAARRPAIDQRQRGRPGIRSMLPVVSGLVLRFAAGVRDGAAMGIGEGEVVGGRGVAGGLTGEIADQVRVDRS